MQKIQNLSFDDIKASLIATLKETDTFKSYDFEASGLNSVINLMAYNTHMIGFYVRMMLSESFVDSAKLKQSMLSHAKLMGYVYKGRRAARAELFVRYDVPESNLPEDMKVVIPRGTKFESNTDTGVKRAFVVIDDFPLTNVIRNVDVNGTPHARFVNDTEPVTPLVVYEGELSTWRFVVPSEQAPHRFVLKRDGVDPSSIKVHVYDTEASASYTAYTLSENAIDINGNSPVFYVTTSEDGYYELVFGNDVFGKSVKPGNMIEVGYIVSSGSMGNTAGSTGSWGDGIEPASMSSGRSAVVDISWWTNRPEEYAAYVPVSAGGMDEESVDDLRFNIPHAFKRQNRIVTEEDYKSIILSEFRNVESINVWGGEKNYRKEYGKVFVCVKPKFTNKLSTSAKAEIANSILKSHGVVGSEVVFVDPDFLKVGLELVASYDKSKTNMGRGQLETRMAELAREYETLSMGTFSADYSDVDMLDYIRSNLPAIKSVFSRKTVFKDIVVRYSTQPDVEVVFGNELTRSIRSSNFIVNGTEVFFGDNGAGSIYMYRASNDSMFSSKSMGTVDYAAGVVNLSFPLYISMTGDADKGSTGILRFTARCVNPDIRTYLNNIIKIETVKATANG